MSVVTEVAALAARVGAEFKAVRSWVTSQLAAYARTQNPTAYKNSAYTAALHEIVMVDASGGPVTITLPAIAAQARVSVKKVDSSANAVTVAAGTATGGGAQTVGSAAAASVPIRTMDQVTTFQGNGTNWVIPYNHLSLSALDTRFAGIGTVPIPVRAAVTANTTAVTGEVLSVNATSAAVTITPPASPSPGARVFVVKTDSSGNTVTWSGNVSGDNGGVVLGAAGAGATLVYTVGGWISESTTTAATGRTGSGSAPASAGARNGTYDPRTNVYSPTGGAGRLIRAQLARAAAGGTPNSGSQLVDLVCLGDSRTAGYYAGATPTDSWPSMMRARLAAAGYPSAGTGLVMASNNSTAVDSRIVLGGSWTAQYPYRQWGASGATATFTSDVPGTVVEVYYYANSGAFTVKIDSAAAESATVGGGATVAKFTRSGLSNTAHTVTVTTGSSVGYLIGFCVRQTTGVVVHSVAWGGISSTTMAATGALTVQGITSAINPSILAVMVGCNDSGSSVPAATHATNMATITSTNNPNPAKALICESPNPTYIDQWPAYVAAQYDRADALGCPLLDLNDRYISPALGNAAGLLGSDSTHETVTGALDLARAVTTMLAS